MGAFGRLTENNTQTGPEIQETQQTRSPFPMACADAASSCSHPGLHCKPGVIWM